MMADINVPAAETLPLYPDIHVQLTGTDGNAIAVLGTVLKAMKAHGMDAHTAAEFTKEATRGDYSHLLMTCMKWVDVS
jgi:hypothetical protein